MKQQKPADIKYRSISLFSGIGGLDIGLERVGVTPILCSELDPNALTTLKANLQRSGHSPYFQPDVTEFTPLELVQKLKVAPGEIDLLVGGPPCQSFSLIGKRKCLDDHRGLLLYKMAEFAEAFQPKVIMIEQVKGLLSAPCEDGVKGGALQNLVRWLERLGYGVNYKVLLAADYGVPQLRERLIIVASKFGRFNFPEPTHANNTDGLLLEKSPFVTVKNALHGLPSPKRIAEEINYPSHVDITPLRDQQRISGVPEGECLAKQLHLPKSQRMNLTEKDTTKFRRLSWNKPSLTLRGGEAFYHPEEDRYLTPREYLRLHGFPDDFILHGPIKGRSGTFKSLDQHRLVANAVPPKLAEVIGKEIVSQFLSQQNTTVRSLLKPKHFDEAYISAATA
jgi:DNA (cytosine-5)-methyltransferase 1